MTTEQKEYYSIDEAAKMLEINRGTLYKWADRLDIQRWKFSTGKKVYFAAGDVEKLREVKEKPWLVEQPIPVEKEAPREEQKSATDNHAL